ncbi:MAG TPA: hypothetical protein DF383_06805, partial [Deltaproteobacteria bacterium]|nr:hypothetical protein [Deltaproteobacteria bacterium]
MLNPVKDSSPTLSFNSPNLLNKKPGEPKDTVSGLISEQSANEGTKTSQESHTELQWILQSPQQKNPVNPWSRQNPWPKQRQQQVASVPLLLPSVLPVKAKPNTAAASNLVTVHNAQELETQLAALNDGEFAMVMFSADSLPNRVQSLSLFESFADAYANNFLMIHAEGINGSEQEWLKRYGIKDVPSIAFIDKHGKITVADDYRAPLASWPQV